MIKEAAEMAELTPYTVASYIRSGHLEAYFGGQMVYYRDLLRAAWVIKQKQSHNSKSYSRNGKKYI
jgi:hypothetical protein